VAAVALRERTLGLLQHDPAVEGLLQLGPHPGALGDVFQLVDADGPERGHRVGDVELQR
jgi:hypothetical protein